jgi:hypothetical protein
LSCPICEKRKGARFCPAKGEKICAVCCGTEREVTIDCPSDCGYLIAAHQYEEQHPREISRETPLLDVELPRDTVYTQQQLLGALAFAVAKFCSTHPQAHDDDVLSALQALAETHRTMISGIFYEKPPVLPLPRELYAAVMTLLAEIKKEQVARSGFAAMKDADVFHLLVFLYRMGLIRTNGRPKSRRFIEFLRAQFPSAKETQREESRIIVP